MAFSLKTVSGLCPLSHSVTQWDSLHRWFICGRISAFQCPPLALNILLTVACPEDRLALLLLDLPHGRGICILFPARNPRLRLHRADFSAQCCTLSSFKGLFIFIAYACMSDFLYVIYIMSYRFPRGPEDGITAPLELEVGVT